MKEDFFPLLLVIFQRFFSVAPMDEIIFC